ncbi:DUF2970 domain-containing protein [Pseudomonas sp. N040]|uniref:DUF2970 domain-containing protein n=1 Tax=Pseudomonas sp. N040 TaxID=2785325 RepID=UPI0018A24B3F|nr:DUF2970 domain-containing protein [Pseudomonas sp. N040]MBF7730676.1 DUF2970 domain-containing protein [Pseudomonas sp. N040]MBW7014319.1 DUF2970 domain-containing protein [Pseudomonas sp. N040]
MNDKPSEQKPAEKPMGLRDTAQSVVAAAFGVQSGKNRARDFSRGKPSHFIALGLIFTILFVLVIVGVVQLVLHLAGV